MNVDRQKNGYSAVFPALSVRFPSVCRGFWYGILSKAISYCVFSSISKGCCLINKYVKGNATDLRNFHAS